ncbi:hypothetical protein [Paenibacillus contaminans]|uniref:Right handed beta helix domain-containing protein n=1 Tax=Paenibacillus contaminans TaxID=450362 RepID=A0A329MHG0_9BACL|nr:hypothetical protein [Paenibacillus contaminans]RAV19274.1 hypothetical protein DQG23_22335 [Paenibacillus contaminans]
MISRRKMIGVLGMGTAAFMLSGKSTFAATTPTDNLKLKLTTPIDVDDVNVNFERIDEEFGSRAVSPDYFKVGTGPDDTDCVQAAFDSGRPVIFTRNYNVKSVKMTGSDQNIDFNGYWLFGISESTDSEAMRDCVLAISGLYLNIYNIRVGAGFKPYKCGIHWVSRSVSQPAEHIKIYGLQVNRCLVGIQYGAYLDDPNPLDAPQSENYIFGIHFRAVQNCLILNQPNGVLKIIGGLFDCSPSEWDSVPSSPYSAVNAYCFYAKESALSIDACEILKVASTEGYGFKGNNFILNNCSIEVASTWGYIDGNATITQNDAGYQGGITNNLFEIAPGAEGRLNLNILYARRAPGIVSSSHIINGLAAAPKFRVNIDKAYFGQWTANKVTSARRENVYLQNTRFTNVVSGVTYESNISDQDRSINIAGSVDTTGENMSAASDTARKSDWNMYVYSGTGTVYFRQNTSDLPAGFRSCIELKVSSGISYIYSSRFPVFGGASLVFSGWAKYTAGTSEQKVSVVWVDAANNVAGEDMIVLAELSTSEWRRIVKPVTAPATAVRAYFQIVANNGSILVTGLGLTVEGDSVEHASLINQMNAALDVAGEGLILRSPNNTRYKITVSDAGVVTATPYP